MNLQVEGLENYPVNYPDYDYTPDNGTDYNISSVGHGTFTDTKSFLTNTLVAISVTISVMGLGGNAVVIWICGWKMKKSVNTTWYLSLAISDFLFCAFLPLEIVYLVTTNWPFGRLLCKLTSSALFLNMFSSVFLLVLISVDRCVMITFPVWSQNHRTVWKATLAVLLMWALSATLTLPALIYRTTTVHGSVTQCHNDYMTVSRHKVVALTRFICGFVIPFLIIVFCCSVLCLRLRSLTIKSTKPYKVMTALILSFFICWVPYHTFILLEFDLGNHNLNIIKSGLHVGVTLAAANSFINPFLYVFIGNDFQRTLKHSFMSRIENAMADDGRTGGYNPTRTNVNDIRDMPL
ncbi:chemerin-like receptor 1 [Lampris incognitus]|uniref:chemerin-like receptor 1 n=1 Tax=Lampris incognitus TaxID=2546036 RepID=UPI0024B4DCE3|nr:chemerin-like receptor 1 [Lampris incognitus]